MESRKEKHDRYLNNLEKHIESAKEASHYSSNRFDILIISLSTSALLFSIGFVKDIISDIDKIDTELLKTSWFLFVLALIANLTSQVTGYYANNYDIKITRNNIRKERDKEIIGNPDKYDRNFNILNNGTIVLNGLSLVFLLSGLITQVLFFSNNI